MLNQAVGIEASWRELIMKLEDIYACKVTTDGNELPVEIHVLASNRKSAKAITRDVQSALAAAFDVEVDFRIISVAQIGAELSRQQDEASEQPRETRLKFSGVEVKTYSNRTTVAVVLERDGEAFTGEVECVNSRGMRCHGVATATLNAVTKYLGGRSFFSIDSADIVDVCGTESIIVKVTCIYDRSTLIGSCLIKTDLETATICAVLNAINRKMEMVPA